MQHDAKPPCPEEGIPLEPGTPGTPATAPKQAREAARAAAARSQLAAAAAVSVTGHPFDPGCNGLYRKKYEHHGWPVLQKDGGGASHLFYRRDASAWLFSQCDNPDDGGYTATIEAADGLLPTGAKTWRAHDGDGWGKHTLTVDVLA